MIWIILISLCGIGATTWAVSPLFWILKNPSEEGWWSVIIISILSVATLSGFSYLIYEATWRLIEGV